MAGDQKPSGAACSKSSFLRRVQDDNEVVVRHAIGMAITIVSIWAFHFLLKWTLGEDAKLYGRLPIIYLAHTGDLLAMLRFCWKLLKEF